MALAAYETYRTDVPTLSLVGAAPELSTDATKNLSTLSSEQAQLASFLVGLATEIKTLVSDLRDYARYNDPPGKHGLRDRPNMGIEFQVPQDDRRQPIVIQWDGFLGGKADDDSASSFPVIMNQRHPALVPPEHQLVIPNITTPGELQTDLPFELTQARSLKITPKWISPRSGQSADGGVASRIIRPFAADRIGVDNEISPVVDYEAEVRTHVGYLARVGAELGVPSVGPLAIRLSK